MRARGLCGAAVLLFALVVAGGDPGRGSARAEEPAPALGSGASGEREPPKASGAPSRRGRSQRQAEREEWWIHAREVLFEDLELSEEQTRAVDAIVESQRAKRRRSGELRAEIEAAQKRGEKERIASLRKEQRALGAQLRNPHARIEEMRALLTNEQRPTFDMNRARLAAEGQKSREARQGQRQRRAGEGAAEGNAQ